MELELEAKKRAAETKTQMETGQEFYDSELEPEELGSELERLIGLQDNNMQQVSLEDALKELG